MIYTMNKRKEYMRKWRQENRERLREWRQKPENRKRHREYMRKWREKKKAERLRNEVKKWLSESDLVAVRLCDFKAFHKRKKRIIDIYIDFYWNPIKRFMKWLKNV